MEREPKVTTYYGCALKQRSPKQYGILLVTKAKGSPSTQEWTGETCATWKAAVARVEALNRELFA